jgi:hypothetical protein
MGLVERHSSPERVRGRERGFEIQLGELGGFELRPTRLFLWPGSDREAQARILSLGRAPRNLFLPRKESEYVAGRGADALRRESAHDPCARRGAHGEGRQATRIF